MEDGLVLVLFKLKEVVFLVLILVVVEDGLVPVELPESVELTTRVLILVVVEDGLVPWSSMLFGEKNGNGS